MEPQIVQTFRGHEIANFLIGKNCYSKLSILSTAHSIYIFQSRFCQILEKLDINYQQNGSYCYDAFKIMW